MGQRKSNDESDGLEARHLQGNLNEPLDAVYAVIREYFPRANKETCDQLAFAIVYRVLQMRSVEGNLWAATIDQPDPSRLPPTLDDL